MAVWTPGSYLVREYAAERRGGHARRPPGAAAAGREDDEEPLADRDRRRARDHAELPRLLPRDVRPHQLGRRRLRDAQRRADVHDAGRIAATAAARRARSSCPPAGRRRSPAAGRARRRAASLPRARLRHARRFTDRRRQPRRLRFTVDGKPHSSSTSVKAGVFDGARAAQDLEDRPGRQDASGASLPYDKYVFFNLLTEASGGLEHKNSRDDDGEPLGDADAPSYLRLAEPRVARVLPRLERQAAAAGRARPVRLRARELSAQPVDRRGPHRLLRRPAGRGAPGSTTPRRVSATSCPTPSGRCRRRPARLTQSAEMASFDAWIKHYRPDENTVNIVDQLLHERRRARLPARRAHPRRDQRREEPGRRDAAGVRALLGRHGLHAGGVPADGERGGRHRPRAVVHAARWRRPRSSTTAPALDWFGLRVRAPSPQAQIRRAGSARRRRSRAAGCWSRTCRAARRRSTPASTRGRDPRHRRFPRACPTARRSAAVVRAGQTVTCSSRAATN